MNNHGPLCRDIIGQNLYIKNRKVIDEKGDIDTKKGQIRHIYTNKIVPLNQKLNLNGDVCVNGDITVTGNIVGNIAGMSTSGNLDLNCNNIINANKILVKSNTTPVVFGFEGSAFPTEEGRLVNIGFYNSPQRNCVSIGYNAFALRDAYSAPYGISERYGVSIGHNVNNAFPHGRGSVCIGSRLFSGDSCVNLGYDNFAGLGYNNYGYLNVAIGTFNYLGGRGESKTAIGTFNYSYYTNSHNIMIGEQHYVNEYSDFTVSIGYANTMGTSASGSIAIGRGCYVTGQNGIALGTNAQASANELSLGGINTYDGPGSPVLNKFLPIKIDGVSYKLQLFT